MTDQLRLAPMLAMVVVVALFVGYACINAMPPVEHHTFPPMIVEVPSR